MAYETKSTIMSMRDLLNDVNLITTTMVEYELPTRESWPYP